MNDMPPFVATTEADARDRLRASRSAGKSIGLVPTMGALHEGHLSLVRAAKQRCNYVVVTIFVNPTQFAPTEDFSKYPRTIEEDLEALDDLGVDLVFMPKQQDLYPGGFSTYVLPPAVADPFEGQFRPEHFRGVATIVLKLFNLLPADIAFFGQKDYQQCQVIQRMVEDLNVPIEIQSCPIIREPDGLAMSSRNRYLSPEDRETAVAISQALNEVHRRFAQGVTEVAALTTVLRDILVDRGITRIDYAAIADAHTLDNIKQINQPAVALVAAHVGATRLIDNLLLTPEHH